MDRHIYIVLVAVLAVLSARNIEEGGRDARDLVLENMVMRSTKFSPQDNSAPSPLVGGGILERKIIIARNGTERTHAEDREDTEEMECCHHVMVGGDQFGGVHGTHSYVAGVYKKIGVCDGRSLYQQETNTEIFMYYVCGRWFIGLEIGVCGGWVFTKTMDICVHGTHEDTWYFISGIGLQQDKSFRVKEACEEPSDPPSQTYHQSQGQVLTGNIGNNYRPFHDYIDRTEIREGKGEGESHTINIQALYKQPLVNKQEPPATQNNNNYLLSLLYE